MTSQGKLLAQVLSGSSNQNIPFEPLLTLLRGLGFRERVKGSHHIFSKEGIPEILNLQPRGSKARAYQVKQVRNLLVQYKLAGGNDGS